jgi:hypothetical protein
VIDMADARVRREISEQELRAAFTACRERATRRGFAPWPDTFEAAMEEPTLEGLIRLAARQGERALRDDPPPTAPPPRNAAPAAAPPRPQHHFKPPQPGAIDMKRRASGERDDD